MWPLPSTSFHSTPSADSADPAIYPGRVLEPVASDTVLDYQPPLVHRIPEGLAEFIGHGDYLRHFLSPTISFQTTPLHNRVCGSYCAREGWGSESPTRMEVETRKYTPAILSIKRRFIHLGLTSPVLSFPQTCHCERSAVISSSLWRSLRAQRGNLVGKKSCPSCPSMPTPPCTNQNARAILCPAGDCPFPIRFREHTANSDQHPSRYPYRSRLSPDRSNRSSPPGSPRPQQRAMPWAWKMRAKSKRITPGRGADHFPEPGQNQPTNHQSPANTNRQSPAKIQSQKSHPNRQIPSCASCASM